MTGGAATELSVTMNVGILGGLITLLPAVSVALTPVRHVPAGAPSGIVQVSWYVPLVVVPDAKAEPPHVESKLPVGDSPPIVVLLTGA